MFINRIYQNFLVEIFKTFFTIIFGLLIISLTVRAVNFLDLIVDSGYPVVTYFKFSFLNLFGLIPKFIPLTFLFSIIFFIFKHVNNRELDLLWVSGVKKIQVVNLFLVISIIIIFLYLIFSIFLTPYALNKSRQLLGQDKLNSFLPTIRSKQFSDAFKGFTYIVDQKRNDEVKNIFLNDKGNNLKNLTSSKDKIENVTIIAKEGVIKNRQMFLIKGQIISSKKNNEENEVVEFKKLKIDLKNFITSTIKQPKLQETSSIKLLSCFFNSENNLKICKSKEAKKEIIPILIRRASLPTYIPVIALVCSFLLLKNQKKFLKRIVIFLLSFFTLIMTELVIRYTGLNNFLRYIYVLSPFILISLLYPYLIYKFKTE